MSVHTKKHLIKVSIGHEKFNLPAREVKALLSLVKTIDKVNHPVFSKGIRWTDVYRESFKNSPEWAVCLRAARSKNSLSQRELSEKSGIPITSISKYENGERKISVNQAKKLAKILKTNHKIFLCKT